MQGPLTPGVEVRPLTDPGRPDRNGRVRPSHAHAVTQQDVKARAQRSSPVAPRESGPPRARDEPHVIQAPDRPVRCDLGARSRTVRASP